MKRALVMTLLGGLALLGAPSTVFADEDGGRKGEKSGERGDRGGEGHGDGDKRGDGDGDRRGHDRDGDGDRRGHDRDGDGDRRGHDRDGDGDRRGHDRDGDGDRRGHDRDGDGDRRGHDRDGDGDRRGHDRDGDDDRHRRYYYDYDNYYYDCYDDGRYYDGRYRRCRYDSRCRYRGNGYYSRDCRYYGRYHHYSSGSSTSYVAQMTADQEVPYPGPTGARGTARINLDAADRLCYALSYQGIPRPTAGHIHRGAAGTSGPVAVSLDPAANGDQACVAADPSVLQDIQSNPGGFYVNLHTDDYPDGAIRGQLY